MPRYNGGRSKRRDEEACIRADLFLFVTISLPLLYLGPGLTHVFCLLIEGVMDFFMCQDSDNISRSLGCDLYLSSLDRQDFGLFWWLW